VEATNTNLQEQGPGTGPARLEQPRERRLLLSWAKAERYSEEGRIATRSEGDDLGESAIRARMRHGGKGRGGTVEVEHCAKQGSQLPCLLPARRATTDPLE
jgi:hypothetical protein